MRYILTIKLNFIFSLFLIGQNNVSFEIEALFIKDPSDFKRITDFEKLDSAFFQDENYYVRRTCSGEFGGSIWFRNKKTEIEYSCSATCPVTVNKIDNNYIVTTSLSHFRGFSSVFLIENPDSMDIFQEPENKRVVNKCGLKKWRISTTGFRKVYYGFTGGDLESKSIKGRRSLVDTIGVNILFSFPYNDQLYHIVSDFNTLYLSKLERNVLLTVDTIFKGLHNLTKVIDGSRHHYNTSGFVTKDNSYVVLFENSGLVGYIEIKDNKIKFTRYQ
jgi:hypothetical protein